MIAVDLSKQKALDVDPIANIAVFFIIINYRGKRSRFTFFTRNCKSILISLFALILNDPNTLNV